MKDLYQSITDRIIAALEAGARPWHQPWAAGAGVKISRPLRHNGQPYNGINILLLWDQSQRLGYQSPYWMTFQQALEFKACVRKGERGTGIVYAGRGTKEDEDGEERGFAFLKGYTVFNSEQIDGLPERFAVPAPIATTELERDIEREAWFEAIPADVRHGGSKAFFSPAPDFIQMPPFEAFENLEAYFAVRAHETVHWAGHKARLDRDLSGRFGTEAYAIEELIAEIGAAFVCADIGLAPVIDEQHAPYLQSWLQVLKSDKRAIFTAAAAAGRAADYLASFNNADRADQVGVAA